MLDSTPISLFINAITAPLSLAFLLLLTWGDRKGEVNPFFGVFLFFVITWNGGALLVQASMLADLSRDLVWGAQIALDLGFIGAGVSAFALTAVLVKAYTRRLRVLALLTLLTILIYRFIQLVNTAQTTGAIDAIIVYRTEPLLLVFFTLFGTATLILLWQGRRALRSRMLQIGLIAFIAAQFIGFTNPQLGFWLAANNLGAIAAVLISMALVRQEIIRPLAERTSQVETLRRVSVGLLNQDSLYLQLTDILQRAAALMRADGAGLYSVGPQGLVLIDAWQLPPPLHSSLLAAPGGIAASAVASKKPVHVDHYAREWRGPDDFPLARKAFGSVACVPIVYGEMVLGAMLVISARQGRLFRTEDLYLLEMLATQVAIIMTYHRLFEHQKELDRLKNEMLRMASHDLKNPLQASMANLELLQDDLAHDPRDDVQDSLRVIDNQLKRMSRIIRGVLDLEKVREGKVKLVPYHADVMIRRAVDELREQAAEKPVTLAIDPNPAIVGLEVLCDVEQFRRALVNLLENGIKFTPAQGEVRISADLDPAQARVIFTIRDTGAGIAPEHQPHIFDRFYRASPQGMEHVNGSGLGLSLVKATVLNHHGDVWFHSREGVGTTFFITLPLSSSGMDDADPD